MLAHITGRTRREEASETTSTFNLVKWIRARRHQWLGHILRMDDRRMLKTAVRYIYNNRQDGDLLMDAPVTDSWEELMALPENRTGWPTQTKKLKLSAKRILSSQTHAATQIYTATHNYNTRSRAKTTDVQPADDVLPATAKALPIAARSKFPTTAQTQVNRAKQYVQQDKHETFFRPTVHHTTAKDPTAKANDDCEWAAPAPEVDNSANDDHEWAAPAPEVNDSDVMSRSHKIELSSISITPDYSSTSVDSDSIFAYHNPTIHGHHHQTPNRPVRHRRTLSFSPNFSIYMSTD